MWHRLNFILFFTEISCKEREKLGKWIQSVQRFAVAILKLLYAVSVTYNKEILIIPF